MCSTVIWEKEKRAVLSRLIDIMWIALQDLRITRYMNISMLDLAVLDGSSGTYKDILIS